MILALIALGGAAGSVSRYLLGGFMQRVTHLGFPIGTLTVNVVGSLAIGLLYRAFHPLDTHATGSALFIVGFCGGFTTFSAFSLDTVGLLTGGEYAKAALYTGLSVVVCIAATAIGLRIGWPI